MRTRSPYCKRAPRLLGVAANMPWNRAVTSAGDAMAGDAMAMQKSIKLMNLVLFPKTIS